MTEHLHAVVRVFVALGALIAPVVAGADRAAPAGKRQVRVRARRRGVHADAGRRAAAAGGRAGARQGRTTGPGVPLRHDLRDALRGGDDPEAAPAASGFFIALEGGDGAGKSTQAEALAEWIRGKGHEVVRDTRAGGHAGRQAAAVDPAGRVVGRPVAPRRRRCCTPPTAPSTWTPSYGPRWSAAPSSSRTATSTRPWRTRAPAGTCRPPRSPGSRAGRRTDWCRI